MEIEMNNMDNQQLYHERHRNRFSVLHSLNCLFQARAFTEAGLNEIADSDQCCPLSSCIFSRHRTVLIGDYDLHLVVEALHERGMNIYLRDNIGLLNMDIVGGGLMGILVNDKYHVNCGLCIYRHWFALKHVNEEWYNFDSKLPVPHRFTDVAEVLGFLADVLGRQHSRIYIVHNQQQL